MRVLICSIVLASAATPTIAVAQNAPAVEQKVEKDRVVCRRETDTGSLVRKTRVCRTVKEWDRFREASRTAVTEGQNSGSSSGQ